MKTLNDILITYSGQTFSQHDEAIDWLTKELRTLLESLVPEEKDYVDGHLKYGYDHCRQELKAKINKILT